MKKTEDRHKTNQYKSAHSSVVGFVNNKYIHNSMFDQNSQKYSVKSDMPSLTKSASEFTNNALWDTPHSVMMAAMSIIKFVAGLVSLSH